MCACLRLAFSLRVCQSFPGCVCDSVPGCWFLRSSLAGSGGAGLLCFWLAGYTLVTAYLWLYLSLSDGLSDSSSVELIVWGCLGSASGQGLL